MQAEPTGGLSPGRLATLADWLARHEAVRIAPGDVTASRRSLAAYERAWGSPAERTALADGTPLLVWRGEGRAFWVADFGDCRAAVAF